MRTHQVVRRVVASGLRTARRQLEDMSLRLSSTLEGYSFDSGKYPGSFVAESETVPWSPPSRELPREIWCFWTGTNEMSKDRARCLQQMKQMNPIRLVTADTIGDVLVDGFPMHPGYEYLSLNHRSDYLRAYVMHHHGGGYSDIKVHPRPWGRAFARLDASEDKWMIGYPERTSRDVAALSGTLGADLRKNYRRLRGCGAFIFRPGSPMTQEWLGEVDARMTRALPQLEEHPGNTWGDNEGYPFQWAELMGSVFHPLSLKYHDRLLADGSIRPRMTGYR